jgi:release factor glutamine methyltransferase
VFLYQLQNQNHLRKNNFRDLVNFGTAFLENSNVDDPVKNAEVLLSHILKKPVYYIYTYWDRIPALKDVKVYAELLERRASYIPVQYITKEVDFFGRSFSVKKGVFIPRPETETLVEKIIGLYKKHFNSECVKMLDIGTGCGNIAITLAKEIRDCSVTATDISLKSLKVSSHNALLHKVKSRIRFEKANLFPQSKSRFNIIVSNPPYIPSGDISTLDEEVKKEPVRALDGGLDGTAVIRRIMRRADAFLYKGGFLLMEIGYGQANLIRNMPSVMKLLRIERDLAGIERVAVFRKN